MANFVSCLDPLPAPRLFCRKSQTLYFTCTISVCISKRYIFKHNHFTISMAPPSKNNPIAASTTQPVFPLPRVSCKWSQALSSLSDGDPNSPAAYRLTCLPGLSIWRFPSVFVLSHLSLSSRRPGPSSCGVSYTVCCADSFSMT